MKFINIIYFIVLIALILNGCSANKITFVNDDSLEIITIVDDSIIKKDLKLSNYLDSLKGKLSYKDDTIIAEYSNTLVSAFNLDDSIISFVSENRNIENSKIQIEIGSFRGLPLSLSNHLKKFFQSYIIVNDTFLICTKDSIVNVPFKICSVDYGLLYDSHIIVDFKKYQINDSNSNFIKIVVNYLDPEMTNCPFCNISKEKYLFQNDKLILIRNEKYKIYTEYKTGDTKKAKKVISKIKK